MRCSSKAVCGGSSLRAVRGTNWYFIEVNCSLQRFKGVQILCGENICGRVFGDRNLLMTETSNTFGTRAGDRGGHATWNNSDTVCGFESHWGAWMCVRVFIF